MSRGAPWTGGGSGLGQCDASNELSDPGHGGKHLRDVPVITFGSARGALKTGNHIDDVKRPYSNMLVTLFHAMGLATGDFERNSVVGFGGYSGYLTKNVDAKYLADAEKRKPLPLLT